MWAATPATVRVVVADLLDRVGRLEERVNKTSRTSSKPPSSDPPSVVFATRNPAIRYDHSRPRWVVISDAHVIVLAAWKK
jgi:hypothetical protein